MFETVSPTLLLHRIDPEAGMRRYYALSIAPTLWGEWSVVREWGRIGVSHRRRVDLAASLEEAAAGFETLARRKRARGYAIVREG